VRQKGELGGAMAVGREAKMADTMEAVGQRVKQEAADELVWLELHYFCRGAASETVPKFISTSNPAAQWTGAHKGHAFFAYADKCLCQVAP
jgi:hypothetical protein